jgi:hypothetical protein
MTGIDSGIAMDHPRLRSWARAILLGAVVGLPVLGGGGRVAMRLIATLTGAPPALTFEGTLTVLLAGAGSGAAAGAIHQGLTVVLRRRRWLRVLAFLVVLGALTVRGLHPVQPLPLALFGTVMALFACLYLAAWRRLIRAPYHLAGARGNVPVSTPSRG